MFGTDYQGRRVLVTGHTGFKGSWLALWLHQLGAEVSGLSLPPEPGSVLFEALKLETKVRHHVGDIRDASLAERVVAETQPEIVFHLAAQPLVRLSYQQPVETWATNVMGTIHVLEAVRKLGKPCTVVAITTDKVYENNDGGRAFAETDPLGGHDPYSSSKAGAEIAIQSWRRSFFAQNSPIALASTRAGNVIGGGDFAADRIVPDAIRAMSKGESVWVRNPGSTRPWQHVLEPLLGYLMLGAQMDLALRDDDQSRRAVLESGWNFGPALESVRPVSDLIDLVTQRWPEGCWHHSADTQAVHEARLLALDPSKAERELGWKPRWSFAQGVNTTVDWYHAVHQGADPSALSLQQIQSFLQS